MHFDGFFGAPESESFFLRLAGELFAVPREAFLVGLVTGEEDVVRVGVEIRAFLDAGGCCWVATVCVEVVIGAVV